MTQQDTQPPAETLAEAREIAIRFALPGTYDGISTFATQRGDADDKPYMRAILAALSRAAPSSDSTMRHLRDALDDSEELMNGSVVITPAHAKQLNADVDAWEAAGDALTGEQAWDELVNVDDRTSPEEYPDMCLITRDELIDFMNRATPKPPAGGDAIPAGWQSIETAPRDGTWFIADGGGLDRPTPIKWCACVGAWEADAVMLEDWDDQAEGYSRPLFWWAIPERRPATPKSPAGGDAPVVEGLARIRTSMALLQQNSEGCALNHYGDDAEAHGLPGWLEDTRVDLDSFAGILAALALPAPVVEGDVERLANALRSVRDDLHNENGLNLHSITDTIWHGPGETTVDFIDATLAALGRATVTESVTVAEADPETVPGRVIWHTSEEGGGPDVGISVGLGNGSALWIGELLDRDGGPVGIVFHGPAGARHAARLSELDEVRDLFEHHVAPAIAALSEGRSHG